MRIDYANAINVPDIATVYINGQPFNGISGLMTVNTKTYVTEPVRSNDGSIENINDYDTFVVPRCKVNFKYLNLNDYQRLCNIVNSGNEFIVKFWDKQFGLWVKHKMYCEPEEMYKLYNVGTSVIGVLDYEISFIGTLNDLEEFNVQLDGNGGALRNYEGEYSSSTTYSKGQKVIWNNNYYEANFEKTTFSEVEPPNQDYWESITPLLWSEEDTYSEGNIVYTITIENGTTKYKYYEAIQDNFSGYLLSNLEYWKQVSILRYSNTKTYDFGGYCYTGIGNSPQEVSYYKAKYRLITFNGKNPDEKGYWELLPILQPQKVKWGNSIRLPDQDDLFDPPTSKTSADKWIINDTENYYLPNSNISVFRNMVLKAKWE